VRCPWRQERLGGAARLGDRGLAELAAYVQAHGDARVPKSHLTPSGLKLGAWCGIRRKDRKADKLSAERIAALDALGFVWDARQASSVQSAASGSPRNV